MAREQVERGRHGLGRVVLGDGHEALGRVGRARLAQQEVEHRRAERVVHGAVELVAQQVATQLAVAHLVGGVLPNLAQHERVVALGHGRALDLRDELVGELVGHVEAPAARTRSQPVTHHARLAGDEVAPALAGLNHGRQVVHAPPAVVGAVGLEVEPGGKRRARALGGVRGIGRGTLGGRRSVCHGVCRAGLACGLHAGLVRLPGTRLLVGVVAVERARVGAHVVEHAVEHDGDAILLGLTAQRREVLGLAQHVVDAQEVGRVVAVVAARLEDGVEVDGGDAHVGNVAQLLLDAGERAAVEVPRPDATALVAVVGGLGVPAAHHAALRSGDAVVGVTGVVVHGLAGELAPARAPAVAVREDLVDDAAREPLGLDGARLVDRELKRGRLPVAEGALAAGPPLLGAVAHHLAIGALDHERVPHDGSGLARQRGREAHAVTHLLAHHGHEALAHAIDPRAHRDRGARCTAHVEP